MALFARWLVLLTCLIGLNEQPQILVDEEHEDVHSQDENVDAGGGGVHPQNGSKEILFVSSGKLHEPYAFCNQVDDATTDTVASHVHARLGLAGRRRGGGFNVSGGAVHGSSGRARTSLGLTRRGRATNGQQAVEHGLQAERSNVAEPARSDVNRAEQGGHDEGGSSVPRDANARRRNTYSDEQKQSIYAMLLERTSLGKLNHGVTRIVSHITGVPWRVVQRIWRSAFWDGMHMYVHEPAIRTSNANIKAINKPQCFSCFLLFQGS